MNFGEGPRAGEPLDRGRQPDTGSTDLLLGACHFESIGRNVDYFAQAQLQVPLRSNDEVEPKSSVSVGLHYAH